MESPSPTRPARTRWTSLWVVALLSLVGQLWLCQFFTLGERVPLSLDVDPSNLWKYAYQMPPNGEFLVLNWFGQANLPPPLNPFSLAAAWLTPWLFFTTYTPIMSTLALLAMVAFLRELELPRLAALFGGLIYAWQGEILPFVFPGHYGYIATWVFFALAAWGALRSQRTGEWACGLISGASCGVMVGLQPDRGAIASLLIAALYVAAAWKYPAGRWRQIEHLALCAGVALIISLAAFLALFQSFIVGVSMGGKTSREQTYDFDTQFSLGPEETLTYLVPGFFGWHFNSTSAPYWGRLGQWPGWEKGHQGMRNLNLAISTTGTVATALALLGTLSVLPGAAGGWFGRLSERQRFFGGVLAALGALALILAWGYHTPLYRVVFALPLMDKWRNPLKWLEVTNFALITLSAFGLQHLIGSFAAPEAEETRQRRRHLLVFLDGVVLLLLAGLFLSLPLGLRLQPVLQADGYSPTEIDEITGTLHLSLIVAFVLMLVADVLVRLLWKPDRLRNWKLENPWLQRAWTHTLSPEQLPLTLMLGLALLSVGQLAWVATYFLRPTSLSFLTATNPLVEKLKSEGNQVRVSAASTDPTLNVLLQNQFSTTQISSLEISAASRVPDDLTTFLTTLEDDPTRLWFLGGVKNKVIPEAAFPDMDSDPKIKASIDHVDGYSLDPTQAPDLPSHALIQFRDYLAKATFVPGAEIFSSGSALLARLKDPNWNPRATVLFSPAPRGLKKTTPGAAAGSPQVELKTYDTHRIDLTVQAPQPGYILINDAFDPDWEVEVNGRTAPLLRADYLFRAVAVPAGNSRVTMEYRAHYRLVGMRLPVTAMNLFCDGFMLLAWLVAGVSLWSKKERA